MTHNETDGKFAIEQSIHFHVMPHSTRLWTVGSAAALVTTRINSTFSFARVHNSFRQNKSKFAFFFDFLNFRQYERRLAEVLLCEYLFFPKYLIVC